jgi:hypothetical protein
LFVLREPSHQRGAFDQLAASEIDREELRSPCNLAIHELAGVRLRAPEDFRHLEKGKKFGELTQRRMTGIAGRFIGTGRCETRE